MTMDCSFKSSLSMFVAFLRYDMSWSAHESLNRTIACLVSMTRNPLAPVHKSSETFPIGVYMNCNGLLSQLENHLNKIILKMCLVCCMIFLENNFGDIRSTSFPPSNHVFLEFEWLLWAILLTGGLLTGDVMVVIANFWTRWWLRFVHGIGHTE